MTREIRIWDLPTRLFHWLLALLIAIAIITVKIGGDMMVWHGRCGQFILALLAFRLAWGFIGSTYARFAHFLHGPGAVMEYLRGRWRGAGHNPLGALAVFALLLITLFQSLSGLSANDDASYKGPLYRAVSSTVSDQLSTWHRQAEWYIYALVALHIAAVLYYTLVRKNNLIRPMVNGKKTVNTEDQAEAATGGGTIALTVALAIAIAVLWLSNGSLISEPPPPPPPAVNW